MFNFIVLVFILLIYNIAWVVIQYQSLYSVIKCTCVSLYHLGI